MKPLRLLIVLFCLVFVFVNGMAIRHAYLFSHYSVGGTQTPKPEDLTTVQKAVVLLTGVDAPKPMSRIDLNRAGLPGEAVTLTTLDGVHLDGWLSIQARSQVLVAIFPGHAAEKSQLLPEAMELYRHGYSVFLIDFRGTGGSDGQETTLGYNEAKDVKAAVDFLRIRVPKQKLFLYGKSMGAVAVMRAVSKMGVSGSGLILECPFDTLLHTVEHRFQIMGVPAFPLAHLLTFWGGIHMGFNAFGFKPVEDAAEVRMSCLLMHGELDKNVTVQEARSIGKALFCRLSIYERAGHESFFKNDPEKWRADVLGFIGSNWK